MKSFINITEGYIKTPLLPPEAKMDEWVHGCLPGWLVGSPTEINVPLNRILIFVPRRLGGNRRRMVKAIMSHLELIFILLGNSSPR